MQEKTYYKNIILTIRCLFIVWVGAGINFAEDDNFIIGADHSSLIRYEKNEDIYRDKSKIKDFVEVFMDHN
jgi:hypothetical protein